MQKLYKASSKWDLSNILTKSVENVNFIMINYPNCTSANYQIHSDPSMQKSISISLKIWNTEENIYTYTASHKRAKYWAIHCKSDGLNTDIFCSLRWIVSVKTPICNGWNVTS